MKHIIAIANQKIRVTVVKKGETISRLSQKMAVKKYKEECLRALNGLTNHAEVRTGQLIKLISR